MLKTNWLSNILGYLKGRQRQVRCAPNVEEVEQENKPYQSAGVEVTFCGSATEAPVRSQEARLAEGLYPPCSLCRAEVYGDDSTLEKQVPFRYGRPIG